MEIGIVGKAHGIRGEVHIRPYHRASDALAELEFVFLRRRDESGEPAADPLKLTVERARPTPDGSWLVALSGVVTRNDAESLRGALVSARRADLPPPDPDELYVEDLLGLAAVDPDGRPLGTVREIYSNGAQEVLIVATDRGDVEVPFVEAHVGEVDLDAGRLVILDLDALVPEP